MSGHVQGVGFRCFVWRAAKGLGLTGWVRNLEDGRVELEAEGQTETLRLFLKEVRRGPRFARVARVDVTEETASGGASFEIRG